MNRRGIVRFTFIGIRLPGAVAAGAAGEKPIYNPPGKQSLTELNPQGFFKEPVHFEDFLRRHGEDRLSRARISRRHIRPFKEG